DLQRLAREAEPRVVRRRAELHRGALGGGRVLGLAPDLYGGRRSDDGAPLLVEVVRTTGDDDEALAERDLHRLDVQRVLRRRADDGDPRARRAIDDRDGAVAIVVRAAVVSIAHVYVSRRTADPRRRGERVVHDL